MILLLINGKMIEDRIPRVKDGLEGNWEGRIIENKAFKKEELKMLVTNEYMIPCGKGCCGLAIRHFDWIQEIIRDLSVKA